MHPLYACSWQSRHESSSSCFTSIFPLIFSSLLFLSKSLKDKGWHVLPAWPFRCWFPSYLCFGHFKLELLLKKCQLPWKQTQPSRNGLDHSLLSYWLLSRRNWELEPWQGSKGRKGQILRKFLNVILLTTNTINNRGKRSPMTSTEETPEMPG